MYGGGGDARYDFGGGGFMPTQTNVASSDQQSSRRSSAPSTGLFPVTVKQIFTALQSNGDDLCVDGQDVSNVTLVGLMSNKEEKQTDISFMLDDGTGRLEVKRWVESLEAPEALEMRKVNSGDYVRVHGHLRTFQNSRTMIAFSVKPITDFNEVTFHFLDCIYVHLYNIKIKGGAANSPVPASFTSNTPAAPMSFTQAPSSFNPPPSSFNLPPSSFNQPPAFNVATTPSAVPPAHAPTSNAANPNPGLQNGLPPSASGAHELNDVQRRILSVFEEPANIRLETGLNLHEVMQKLRMPEATFKPTIQFLINEGFIYSTIDELHYRSTHGA